MSRVLGEKKVNILNQTITKTNRTTPVYNVLQQCQPQLVKLGFNCPKPPHGVDFLFFKTKLFAHRQTKPTINKPIHVTTTHYGDKSAPLEATIRRLFHKAGLRRYLQPFPAR